MSTQTESSQQTVSLRYRSGYCSVLPELSGFGPGTEPLCHWLDPLPVLPVPPEAPRVYGEGYPRFNGHPVAELRLFWAKGGLYLVAWDGGGYRWFEFTEEANPRGDGWEGSLDRVLPQRSQVLLRGGMELPARLIKVEYIRDNITVAWRLAPPEGGPQARAPRGRPMGRVEAGR